MRAVAQLDAERLHLLLGLGGARLCFGELLFELGRGIARLGLRLLEFGLVPDQRLVERGRDALQPAGEIAKRGVHLVFVVAAERDREVRLLVRARLDEVLEELVVAGVVRIGGRGVCHEMSP